MLDPVTIFIGVDPRQPVGFTVLAQSIMWKSSRPVCIRPLVLSQLPIKRQGLTQFTFSRFLVPYLCDYKGSAIFMDADIVVTGDIAELIDQADILSHDVQVMQEQPKFEWASVMMFNNMRCRKLTPEFIDDKKNLLFDLAWAQSVGTFSKDWNYCAGYGDPQENPKLIHYTQGLPIWPETDGNFPAEDAVWHREFDNSVGTVSWRELMGGSVHAQHTLKRQMLRKLDMVTSSGDAVYG